MVNDATDPPAKDDDEMSAEEEARLMRRYRLGAVAEASATMENVLRAIFGSLLASPLPTQWVETRLVEMGEDPPQVGMGEVSAGSVIGARYWRRLTGVTRR